MNLILLTDIPKEMLRLIKPATRGGASIWVQHNGHGLGQLHSAFIMHNTYRLYIESDNGSGEHRYSLEEASNIYLSISC